MFLQGFRRMADHSIPHFHNSEGLARIEVGSKEFQCVDSAPVGRHKYTVRLEWRDHSFRPLDPWVVNK